MSSKKQIEILKIEKDKKKFIVTTNEKEYKFDEDIIVEFMILKGKVFTDTEFKKIIKASEVNDLFDKALHYISFAQRSEYEIYCYLGEKGANDDEKKKIIKKLKDFGYIDDNSLANYLFDYEVRQKKGPNHLRNKLNEKKINQEIIDEVVSRYNSEIEQEVIDKLMTSIIKRNNDKPAKIQKLHAYEKLMRDGFRSDAINHVLNYVEFVDEPIKKLPLEIEKLEYKYRDLDKNKKREKMIASLLRKGYEYSVVSKYLD